MTRRCVSGIRHWRHQIHNSGLDPLHRAPEEIVAAALYLAGGGASLTSGTTIRVDGGTDRETGTPLPCRAGMRYIWGRRAKGAPPKR